MPEPGDTGQCKTCIHFLADFTHCRAHTPQLITIIEFVGGSIRSHPWSGWPIVKSTDSCGEWKFE